MEKKHYHTWIEKNNKFFCECGAEKLNLIEDSKNILIGVKDNGSKYRVRKNRERTFLPGEWKLFYDNLKQKQKITFHLLLITGARIMEIQHIKKEDIDFPNQRLVLKKVKRRKESINKSSTRILRINKKITKELFELLKDLPPSFQLFKCFNKKCELCKDLIRKTKDNIILSTSGANIAMKKALIKAKIKDYDLFSIHSIRKTSETWALSLGIDVMILSKRFGHNLITMYQHYSQSDAYTYKEKDEIKEIFGDVFI